MRCLFSFRFAIILFFIGLIGFGLAFYGDFPDNWILVSFAIGLSAWLLLVILNFIDRTFVMIHHLKRSREIQKEFKQELAEEKNQVIQRGSSQARKRAASKRLKLWVDTILGNRE